jgi:hypothetical protein
MRCSIARGVGRKVTWVKGWGGRKGAMSGASTEGRLKWVCTGISRFVSSLIFEEILHDEIYSPHYFQ